VTTANSKSTKSRLGSRGLSEVEGAQKERESVARAPGGKAAAMQVRIRRGNEEALHAEEREGFLAPQGEARGAIKAGNERSDSTDLRPSPPRAAAVAAVRTAPAFPDDVHGDARVLQRIKLILGAMLLLFMLGVLSQRFRPSASAFLRSGRRQTGLNVASWNVAAINNNPFEYWLTLDDNPAYDELMERVQSFVEEPGSDDLIVGKVITDRMVKQLFLRMRKQRNFEMAAVDATENLWRTDFKKRTIVEGFLKDGMLGKKRLTSMPDRVTNTIPLKGGSFAYRPTAINCYESSLDSKADWWVKWLDFMFDSQIDTIKAGLTVPVAMFSRIPRAKYPLLTEEEERISIPLQTLCAAIFDGILIHMMGEIDQRMEAVGDNSNSHWQDLRHDICESLNLKKNDKILEILAAEYMDRDVIFLQEVSGAFIMRAAQDSRVGSDFHVVAPLKRSNSDQNSVILLSKERFPTGVMEDITMRLVFEPGGKGQDNGQKVAPGDVLVVHATDAFHNNFVLASFHGDTNGLQTKPVVHAVAKLVAAPEYLLFGLDANTYESGSAGVKQDMLEFVRDLRSIGFDSCWGANPNPRNYTTFNARTYLQSQLNKASAKSEIREKGDVNPKDFILFKARTMIAKAVRKDNTGKRRYIENMVFPTLDFPSDHGILSADLELKSL